MITNKKFLEMNIIEAGVLVRVIQENIYEEQ